MWSLRVENDHMSMHLCTLHYGNVVYSRLKSDCMCIVDYIHGNLHCGNVYRVLIVQVPTGFSSTTWFIRLHMSVIGQFDKDCSNSTVLYSSSVCKVMNERKSKFMFFSHKPPPQDHTQMYPSLQINDLQCVTEFQYLESYSPNLFLGLITLCLSPQNRSPFLPFRQILLPRNHYPASHILN